MKIEKSAETSPIRTPIFLRARYLEVIFQGYTAQIDSFPNCHFDVILKDGRAHPSCLKHSVREGKTGGWVVPDNASGSRYLENTGGYLVEFSCAEFYGAGP